MISQQKQRDKRKNLLRLRVLEQRVGSPGKAAKLLGVAYRGTYAPWKSGKTAIPRYINRSMIAHLELDDKNFRRLLAEAQDGLK